MARKKTEIRFDVELSYILEPFGTRDSNGCNHSDMILFSQFSSTPLYWEHREVSTPKASFIKPAALLFAFIYWTLGPQSFDTQHLNFNLITLFYYSVVTFTTLGFGDIIPKTTTAAMWVTVEVMW